MDAPTIEELAQDLVDMPNDQNYIPEPVEEGSGEGGQEGHTEGEGGGEAPVIEPEAQTTFDNYKDLGVEFPEDFKLEGLTKDQIKEKAQEIIKGTGKAPEEEDPFIANYKKAKEAGLTHEQYMERQTQRKQFLSMPADQGLKQVYQSIANENGERKYTDEQIDEHLQTMTAIEKDQQWNNIKAQAQQEPEQEKQDTQFVNKTDEYNKSTLPTMAEKFSSEYQEDLLGIPFGESDKKEFNEKYKDMLSIDAEGEIKQFYPSKLLDVMNDAKKVYELLYIHEKLQNGGLQKFINDAKETAIEEALKKAGIEPQRGKSGKASTPLPPQSSDDFL